MKKLFYIVAFVVVTTSVVAQSNIRLNNYWGNAHYINPASIYDKYQAVFSMAGRKQWAGIPGAPSTLFASGLSYFEDYQTQLGLILIQDKIGYTSTTNVNLSYAYAVLFDYDWQIHLGLGANYQNLSYDLSKMNMSSDLDPFAYERLKPQSGFDADIGFEVTNKWMRAGIVSQNIFSLFSDSPDEVMQTNTNFIYAKFRNYTNDIVNVGFGVCGVQYANFYQMELNFTTYFRSKQHYGLIDKPDLFSLGVFYRTKSEGGLILGFNITESLHVSYSYDFHFGAIRHGSIGTNELMLTYNLNRKPTCRNCWY